MSDIAAGTGRTVWRAFRAYFHYHPTDERLCHSMEAAALIARYGYAVVFAGTLLEGETLLLLAGYAAHRGYLDWATVVIVAWLGATLGDQFWFALGRFRGTWLRAAWPALDVRMTRALVWIGDHPDLSILAMRFLWGLRAALPVALGMSRVSWARFLALFRLVWARGQARLITLGPRRGPTAAVETWLDGHCQRTPCGQSGDVASDRGGKLGTTLKCFSLLGRDVPRVAPGLPPLIPPLPTLRRARPAAGPGRLRRNNNWLSDCSDTNGLAAYPHQTEQTPFFRAQSRIGCGLGHAGRRSGLEFRCASLALCAHHPSL